MDKLCKSSGYAKWNKPASLVFGSVFTKRSLLNSIIIPKSFEYSIVSKPYGGVLLCTEKDS